MDDDMIRRHFRQPSISVALSCRECDQQSLTTNGLVQFKLFRRESGGPMVLASLRRWEGRRGASYRGRHSHICVRRDDDVIANNGGALDGDHHQGLGAACPSYGHWNGNASWHSDRFDRRTFQVEQLAGGISCRLRANFLRKELCGCGKAEPSKASIVAPVRILFTVRSSNGKALVRRYFPRAQSALGILFGELDNLLVEVVRIESVATTSATVPRR
jgi:hypothetical protein